MRINEDYIETLTDDELTDDRIETSSNDEHTYRYIICFGQEPDKFNEADMNRFEKMIAQFPFVNGVSRLVSEQDIRRGRGTYMTVRNGSLDIHAEIIFEIKFVAFGIDTDFRNNTKKAFPFMLWLYKLPRERVKDILIIENANNEDSVNMKFIIPQSFTELLDFIEYRNEQFNSSERNPNRVGFSDFIENVAFISQQETDDVIPYIFRKMDIIDVYVRADNRNREETRISEELRKTVKSGEALKKYNAYLPVLQDKYKDCVKMRYAEYQKVLDECLWSVPYQETEYSTKNCSKLVSMNMSSIGVKKNTGLCDSYIEMAIFCDVRNQIVSILVAIVKDTKTFMKLLKDIIPDVSDEELLAIKKEISKLK